MKLQDPRLEALLEAYRDDRRPTEAMRQRMARRFEHTRSTTRARRWWSSSLVATAVAVAALVLLWFAARGLSGRVATIGEDAPGMQAPFDHDRAEGGRALPAHGEHQAIEVDPATHEGAIEPRVQTTPTLADPTEAPPAQVTTPRAGMAVGTSAGPRSTVDTTTPGEPPGDAELTLIEAAEAALRAGEPERALGLLRQHEQRFARATTAQERQALRVLALCAAGREAEGRGARWVFLREHPGSAYRERIERACTLP